MKWIKCFSPVSLKLFLNSIAITFPSYNDSYDSYIFIYIYYVVYSLYHVKIFIRV